ncbi:MAG TPA: aspartate/glutamate racemase family protein [Nocardioidaceae bacterium]|nr:aspartate/glutamate racemase family protein [Nocardioidaceae bacterium]
MSKHVPGIIYARAGQIANGYPIGMLCAQWNIPFVRGDLNHAGTFDFPMRYVEVEGLIGADILRGDGEKFTELIVTAAKNLETEGVRAITSNCGFMAVFQDAVSSAVNVPVFLSSLLQLDMVTRMVGPNRRIGILSANSEAVTPALLAGVGSTNTDRIVIQGLEGLDHFREVILDEVGEMDPARFASEVVDGARQLHKNNPDLGAIVSECSDLPPYSAAIRGATGLPVFDWASFIDYVHHAVAPRTYNGTYWNESTGVNPS